MKKIVFIAVSLFLMATAVQAKVHFGVRGGYNITTLSFNDKVLSASNRKGFYVGPTMKVGLPAGFGFDLSVIYDQREGDAIYSSAENLSNDTYSVNLRRQALCAPINLRYNIGLGSVLGIFIFAGPQFDLNLNKDIKDTDLGYSWKTSTYNVNVGFGLTLAEHVEIRANYSIPCGESGNFTFKEGWDGAVDGINNKTGAWQLGAAIYF